VEEGKRAREWEQWREAELQQVRKYRFEWITLGNAVFSRL
jgi:hypothetical protein